MAGYLEFTTGQVLTAAQVNTFLMEQAVMTFADATARTAALAGVLREGILTYNEDTAQLEIYDGTAFVAAAPVVSGIGSNVVQAVKTDTFTTTSGTYVDIPDMSVTITPSTDTSKVLVIAYINWGQETGWGGIQLQRGSTGIFESTTASSANHTAGSGGFDNAAIQSATISYVDSPTSDTAQTYKLRARRLDGGTFSVNRRQVNNSLGVASSIIAIEVAP